MYLQEKVLAPWVGELTERFARLRTTRFGQTQLANTRVTRSRKTEERLSTTDLDCEPQLITSGS